MSHYLEYDRHLGQLRRRHHCRRRRAYASASNTASHDDHKKIEAPRTSRNKFHDWLEKTTEQTTETKDNNPETIEVRVFKNE